MRKYGYHRIYIRLFSILLLASQVSQPRSFVFRFLQPLKYHLYLRQLGAKRRRCIAIMRFLTLLTLGAERKISVSPSQRDAHEGQQVGVQTLDSTLSASSGGTIDFIKT
jgi:hypothetical protein